MSKSIFHSTDPITLVGGAQASPSDLAEALTMAPDLVAVDSGLVLAMGAGTVPQAVIGDMDSVPPDVLSRIDGARQHLVSEQQTTDFDKALRNLETPVVIGVGFCGGRIDHQLAAFHTLLLHADRPCVLLAESEIILLAPPRITLGCAPDEIVSLFPLRPCAGHSTGLQWPIEGLRFDPARFVGTSNRALGPVEIEMHAPAMLLILGRHHLKQVVAHFAQGGARWPARAI